MILKIRWNIFEVYNNTSFMLKILQQQAQTYLKETDNFLQRYLSISERKQKIHFLLMLLYNNDSDTAFNFLSEVSTSHQLQVKPLLTAIWAYSLHLLQESQEAKNLFQLISQLHGRNFIDKSEFLSQLPEWVTQGAGLVESQTFDKKIKRVYTKINYEQNKHSLIRQSNQGYSKVILLLMGIKDAHEVQAIWKKILSLVGNFDLDPDRVLDLIVEARLQNVEGKNFITLLKYFKKESIVISIGNKLSIDKEKSADREHLSQKLTYCGPPQNFDEASIEQLFREVLFIPNPRLTELASKCIKEEIFSYQNLRPYLEPSDLTLKKISAKKYDLMQAKISKSFTMSMVQIDDNELLRIFNEENVQFQGQLLHSSKLSLINEILKINNWTDFVKIWKQFKNKFDLILYQPILHTLLDLFEWAIEPLMESSSFHKFFKVEKKEKTFFNSNHPKEFKQLTAVDEISVKKITELMTYIGRYIGFRPRVFIKLCRLFKRITKQYEQNPVLVNKIKELTKFYLVPANGYCEGNPLMAIELYSYLQNFDYHFRYECYMIVYKQAMTGNAYVARIFQSIKRRQNIIVNNLSKENKKLFIKKIAKLTHNQALPVLYWIARRIVMEDYEAVVPEIVSVLANATPLTLDMTIFIMIFVLNQHKQAPVNAKTHEFQPWFKNITTFISNFFRKYLDADIQPVFDYILLKTGLPFEQLQEEDDLPGSLLKLLHQLLNKMHGSVMIEEVNKTKLDAIAAGPKLQVEILDLSSEVKAAKKSKVMLEKFFWEQNKDHQCGRSLAFNLLVLLIQKRAQVFTKGFIDNLKIVADIYDDFTLLVVQLVRVLQYQSQDFNHYAILLPENSLSLLFNDYKVPLEMACQIVRPGVKHIATMNEEEWDNIKTKFTSAYLQCLKDENYLKKSYRANEQVTNYLNLYKERVFDILPPSFFTSFWFLTLDSVYFPQKCYSEKIEDIKKKVDQYAARRNQKQVDRTKGLHDKLVKEEEHQRKKYEDTINEQNLKKLEVECLKNTDKQKEKKENTLNTFAQTFVQLCLLPRMMLDRAEALYCVKFTTSMIKANKMAATKSIRLVTFIIEYVMNYLPFTTHREANTCLSVFLSEILSIFINWSDSAKLKQDLKRVLGVEESQGKDNYPKLRDYLIRLFQRVGNNIKSIKEEPYIIKNCLYLLQKVDSIPGFKQQADDLMQHMNQLKQTYSTAVDMRTILDRQIAMLNTKKQTLPQKPEEKKVQDKKVSKMVVEEPVKRPSDDTTKKSSSNTDKVQESSQKQMQKQQQKTYQKKSPVPQPKSPSLSRSHQSHQRSEKGNDQNVNKTNFEPMRQHEQTPSVSIVSSQANRPQNPLKGGDKGLEERKAKLQQQKLEKMEEEKRGKSDHKSNREPSQNKFSDRPENKFTDKPENRFSGKPENKFSDRPYEKKSEPRQKLPEHKEIKGKQQAKSKEEPKAKEEGKGKEEPKSKEQSSVSQAAQQKKEAKLMQSGEVRSPEGISNIPPPKKLIDVIREQQEKKHGVSGQQKDNSLKPKQQPKIVDNVSKSSKPNSNFDSSKISTEPPKHEPPQQPAPTLKTSQEPKHPQEQKEILNPTTSPHNPITNHPHKEEKISPNRQIQKLKEKDRKRQGSQFPQGQARKDKWRDQGRRWDNNQANRQRPPYFSRDHKTEDRRGEDRRDERTERQKRDKDRERDRDRDREKDKDRRYEKYRSRSRQKYSRR